MKRCLLPALLASASLALACSDSASSAHRSSSSSIALDEASGRLWLTSPDDDAVVALDPSSLEVLVRIDVPGAPEQLARMGGLLVVTRTRSASVAVIDEASGAVRDVPTPCGGTQAVALAAGGQAWVSCRDDDLLLRVAPAAGVVEAVLPSPGRPTALAINGDRVAVTASREGRVRVLDATSGRELDARDYGAGPGVSASQLDAVAAAGTGFAATYQLVDHDSDRARPPEQGGYGGVVAERPRIAPAVAADGCAAEYARFTGGVRVASGPSALAFAPATATLWVAHRSTDNVLVLDCAPEGPGLAPVAVSGLASLRAAFRTGRGPRGIVVSADGRTAYVDVGFDQAVARLELAEAAGDTADRAPPDAPQPPALARTRALGPARRLSVAAAQGRASFFDATNTHLTPSGVVTCGTCHPSGGEDGLSWFLHTRNVARKLRRTPPAWSAKRALAPFHWDGEFTDAAVLTRAAIVELMEGDGLVVDVSAIAAYLEALEPPHPRPVRDRAQWEVGRALFDTAGCAECHPAPRFTDGLAHDVLAASTDPDGLLAPSDTPSLLGVRARPPYLHDGRARALSDVLTTHNTGDAHGRTAALSAAERDALIAYLESL